MRATSIGLRNIRKDNDPHPSCAASLSLGFALPALEEGDRTTSQH